MENIFGTVVGFFQTIGESVIMNIMSGIAIVLLSDVMKFIYIVLFLVWAIKKGREGDLFRWETLSQVVIFFIFTGFVLWALNSLKSPNEQYSFYTVFNTIIKAPANYVSKSVINSTTHLYKDAEEAKSKGYDTKSTNDVGLSWLVSKSMATGQLVFEKIKIKFSVLGGGSIGILILLIVLLLIYYLGLLIFVIVVMLISIMTGLQITVFSTLAPVAIVLLYFAQSRGVAGQYFKTILGFTLYQPLLLIVASFGFAISNWVASSISEVAEKTGGSFLTDNWLYSTSTNNLEQMWYLVIGIVGVVICIYLATQIPSFIQGVIGGGGGVGAGVAAMGGAALGAAGGAMIGGAVSSQLGQVKSAYQGAGGGAGGLAQGAMSLATGGLSSGVESIGKSNAINDLSKKGGAIGAVASAAKSGANWGMKINDKMNNTNIGSGINDRINKMTGSSAVIKNIADKASGKNTGNKQG